MNKKPIDFFLIDFFEKAMDFLKTTSCLPEISEEHYVALLWPCDCQCVVFVADYVSEVPGSDDA